MFITLKCHFEKILLSFLTVQALYELVKCNFNAEEALRRLHFNVKVFNGKFISVSVSVYVRITIWTTRQNPTLTLNKNRLTLDTISGDKLNLINKLNVHFHIRGYEIFQFEFVFLKLHLLKTV